MPDALIGHTGFVGGNILRQHAFDAFYNSRNIESIVGQSFDLLVVSAMPAAKWIANKDPASDWANCARLIECIKQTRSRRVVLISTVDVYATPRDVTEDTPLDPIGAHAYGRHRLMLERALIEQFSDLLVIRLPGLFGHGLRKNVIYDLLNDNEVDKIHADAIFQWYPVDRLWSDIAKASEYGIALLNVATEPLSVTDMAREAFGMEFGNRPDFPPAHYDMRSLHAVHWGGRRGYLYERQTVIADLKQYVETQRKARH